MWRKDDLLHPATVIAGVALFVSLGGVTYAAATIGTAQIKNGAVTRAKIKSGAISPSRLANGAVTNQKLASNAVTPAKIRGRAVTVGKIADGAVQTSNLETGAVSESKLGAGAVTPSKLGAGAVGTVALADGAVTPAKLAPGTVVTGKGSVTSFHRQMSDGQTLTVAAIPGFGTLSASCASGNASSMFSNDSGNTVTVRRASFSTGSQAVVSSWVGTGATALVANPAGDQQVLWQLGFTDAQGTDHVATANVSNVLDGTGCYVMGQVQSTG